MAGAASDPNDRPSGQLTPEATRMALALSLVFIICIFATAFATRRSMLGSRTGVAPSSVRWRWGGQQELRGGNHNDRHLIFGESHRAAELAAVYGGTRDRLDELERRRQRGRVGIRGRRGLRMEDVERFEVVRFIADHGEIDGTDASDSTTFRQVQHEQQREGQQDQLGRLPILSRITTTGMTQDNKSRILDAIRGAVVVVGGGGSTSTDSGLRECSICTEDFVDGVRLRKLPCGHMFHPRCIDQWLRERARTCPLCRLDLEAYLARIDAAKRDGVVKEPQRAKLPLETV